MTERRESWILKQLLETAREDAAFRRRGRILVLPGAPRLYRLDRYVCINCFNEPGLVKFIESQADECECYFCGTIDSNPIAAHIDDVSGHFFRCLFEEYDDANNLIGWEGDFIGPVLDTDELLFDVLGLEFPQGNQDRLLPELMGLETRSEMVRGIGIPSQ